jgi:hypothetical protein
MWFRLFFAVSGPDTGFETRGPLTLPGWTFIGFVITGLIAFFAYARRLVNDNSYKLMIPLGLSIFYILILFADGYSSYRDTAQPVAINGRYLLPVLLPLMAIFGMALSKLLRKDKLRLAFSVLAILGIFAGGGVFTTILRSDDGWLWNNSVVLHSDHAAKKVLAPLTPGSSKPIQYLR